MKELERYLAAHQHILDADHPKKRYINNKSKERENSSSLSRHPKLSSTSSSTPFSVKIPSSSKGISPSKSLIEGQQKIKQAQERAQVMKMEFRVTVDHFLNNYLEEWRNQRKHRLRKFLNELDHEQSAKVPEVEPETTFSDLKSSQMRKSRLTILPASSDSNIGEERGVTGYMSSNFRSKSYSRLYSDISAHLRVIENTCQRYTIEGHTRTDSLFQHPKHPENQHYEVNERSSSPPPPPPPLLLPSPQYSVSECHQNDSIVSPLCSPQIKNHQNLQSFPRKQLFSESNQSVALPAADTPAKPSLSHNISLDSPTGDSETKRDKFHASTHFLVPGGLSIDHPTLSPHSFNQKQ